MKSHLCLVILALSIFGPAAHAQNEEIKDDTPLVEVYHDIQETGDYRDRRSSHGFMFSANYQGFLPKNYISTLDSNPIYTDAFGKKSISMIEFQLAYKYNFSLGALTFGLGYGTGSVESDLSGDKRSLEVTKPSASIGYIMDALFAEPYVAPYLQLQAWQMGIKEKSSTDDFNGDTKMGFDYTVGLLLQLNALDPSSAAAALNNTGLENTYLDVFVTKYTKTQSTADADTETDFNFGAGLRLEF